MYEHLLTHDLFPFDEFAEVYLLLAVKAGAIGAVVAVMRTHVHDAHAMEQASSALRCLCFNGCVLQLICEWRRACWMKSVCEFSDCVGSIALADKNVLLAGRAGAIDAVLTAIMAYADNNGVCEQAFAALCNICKTIRTLCSVEPYF